MNETVINVGPTLSTLDTAQYEALIAWPPLTEHIKRLKETGQSINEVIVDGFTPDHTVNDPQGIASILARFNTGSPQGINHLKPQLIQPDTASVIVAVRLKTIEQTFRSLPYESQEIVLNHIYMMEAPHQMGGRDRILSLPAGIIRSADSPCQSANRILKTTPGYDRLPTPGDKNTRDLGFFASSDVVVRRSHIISVKEAYTEEEISALTISLDDIARKRRPQEAKPILIPLRSALIRCTQNRGTSTETLATLHRFALVTGAPLLQYANPSL